MTADTHAAALAVTRLDGRDAHLRDRAHDILARAGAHDVPDSPPPCRHRFVVEFTTVAPGYEYHRFVASTPAGEVVGFLHIELFTIDNTDSAHVEITVPPELRRRGIGRRLYGHAVRFLRERGRSRMFGMAVLALPDGPPRDGAGAAFCAAMGMTNGLDDVRRRLDVAAVDWSGLDDLVAAARQKAAGYTVLQWTRPPEEYLADVAELEGRLSTDAPLGDLVWEKELVDADRLRRTEEVRAAKGDRSFVTVARHDASGAIVAMSGLTQFFSDHDHAWQGITLVHPDHRGHRLGTVVKIDNLRYALAHLPGLRYIDTWNAAVNDHMIGINEAMGFVPVDLWQNTQQEIHGTRPSHG